MAGETVIRRRLYVLVATVLSGGAVFGQENPVSIRSGERLSDWILRQPGGAQAYLPGLAWHVPAQRDEQAKLKNYLLAMLATNEMVPERSRQHMARRIEALPVTGRVPIPMADPRWMQGHPAMDPVLSAEHQVLLSQRPTVVGVLAEDGRLCALTHRPGMTARDYLQACEASRPVIDRIDQAWVIQPDATVRRFGIAGWNAETQDEPAPGALIWAPARDSVWSNRFSRLLAEFLSTQSGLTLLAEAEAGAVDWPASVPPPPRDLMLTNNDWGMIGLLQTPTARMAPAGEARFHYSRVLPYERSNIMFQPLEGLEAGFRYTNVTNRLYGATIAGDQQYKDKSFDFKLRLTKEQAYLPEIAMGIIDVGGTGLFSSEYLVASKRTGNLDWSLGIGWGYLGGRGDLRNPLSLLSKSFDTRKTATGQGGTVSTTAFFRGPAALFGGVQYQTPWEKWVVKAEFDGNSYQREPQANNQKQTSPVNVGVVYRQSAALDLTAGIERGNTFMLGLTFHSPLDKLAVPKVAEGPMVPVSLARPSKEPDWALTAMTISTITRWSVGEFARSGKELRVVLNDPQGTFWQERIDRAVAVLHRDAPADIDTFVLSFVAQGIPMSERVVLRQPWVLKQLQLQAMSERIEAVAARDHWMPAKTESLWKPIKGTFGYDLVPSFQQNLGGPDGFLLYRASMTVPAVWNISDSTFVSGAANLGLIDNYEKFKYDIPSNLPRVRTLLREYTTQKSVTIPSLQATTVGRLSNNQFYSFYGGLLESMYAGVGGEWFYRPWHSPLAFGIDVNVVRQRDFKQLFALRDYSTVTGHATLNWDTGWNNTHVSLSAGRYLAKDLGMTLDVSRTFDNGISLGVWATKTNVSAEQFGEGSFDKGVYLRIPFDVMMTSYSGTIANLVWQPIIRDGGAKLSRNVSLYNVTKARDKRETSFVSALDGRATVASDETPSWLVSQPYLDDIAASTRAVGTGLATMDWGRSLLLGGGMILASSVLDRPASKWADSHQTGGWNRVGKVASATPFLLAAGTGLLWWGVADEVASDTAWASIKSAALTLGVESVAKFAVGRSRPEDGMGAMHFSPLSKGANSSFPSIHMGAAYALVTPFAQRYDAPWLYGLAGITAFGRVQERKHFVSDVVAGALIGYGIGSVVLSQHQERRGVPRIAIGADRSIMAIWELE